MADQPESQSQQTDVRRAEDFISLYANNVIVEATAWDLRLTFGQFDTVNGRVINTQRAAVTIPFGMAKLALFWVQINIASHEIETGKTVGIRGDLLPPEPPPLSEADKKNPIAVKAYEAFRQLREEFLAKLR